MKKRRKRERESISPVLFFGCYFALIILAFILSVVQQRRVDYEAFPLGAGAAENLLMDDSVTVDFSFHTLKESAWGITLDDFYDRENQYEDEILSVKIIDGQTGELEQETEIKLAEQYSEGLYSTKLYIPFEKVYPAEKHLHVILRTVGIGENSFYLKKCSTSENETVTRINGTVVPGVCIRATEYYVTEKTEYMKQLLFLVGGVLIGLLLLYLHKTCRLPVVKKASRTIPDKMAAHRRKVRFEGGAKAEQKSVLRNHAARTAIQAGLSRWKLLAGMLLIAGVMVIFWDYIYTFSVERTIKRQSAQLMSEEEGLVYANVHIADGETISQTIHMGEDFFSGLGIWIVKTKYTQNDPAGNAEENDNGSDTGSMEASDVEAAVDAQADDLENDASDQGEEADDLTGDGDEILEEKGKLVCSVYRLSDNSCVMKRTFRIDQLTGFNKILSGELSNQERKVLTKSKWLDMDSTINRSEGETFRIEFKAKDAPNGITFKSFYGGEHAILQGEPLPVTLCMTALFKSRDYLGKIYTKIGLFMTLLICMACITCIAGKTAVEHMLPVCMLFVGLVFSLLIPPYCIPDERAHIDTAYRISNELARLPDDAGPDRIYMRYADIAAFADNTMDVTAQRYDELKQELFRTCENRQLVPVYYRDSVGNTTPVHYLPAALGFLLARALNLNRITMIMFGRWMSLLICTFLIWAGIKMAPFGKEGFAVVAMLPMCLQQIMACSYDGLIISAAFLFTGSALHVLYEDESSLAEYVALLASGAILTVSKGGVYLPMLGILLLLLKKKEWKLSTRIVVSLGSLFSLGVLFMAQFFTRLLRMFSRGAGSAVRLSESGSSTKLYTLGYFIDNPKQLIRILQNTFYIRGDAILGELLGSRLGKLNIYIPWFVLVAVFVLLFVAIQSVPGEKNASVFARGYCGILSLIGTILIMVSMLLAWTSKGSEYVDGLQGRYFLPYFVFIVPVLRTRFMQRRKQSSGFILPALLILLSVIIGNAVYYILK